MTSVYVWSLQDKRQTVDVPDNLTDLEIIQAILAPNRSDIDWSANDDSGDYHQPIMIVRDEGCEEILWEHPTLGRYVRDDEVVIVVKREEAMRLDDVMMSVDDGYVIHNKIRAALGWEPLGWDEEEDDSE